MTAPNQSLQARIAGNEVLAADDCQGRHGAQGRGATALARGQRAEPDLRCHPPRRL